MSKRADISGKQTINIYNRAWAEWVLQDQEIVVEAELSGEFQFIGRASDSLLRVHSKKNEKSFLSLTELQLRHDKKMPKRTTAYAALARQQVQPGSLRHHNLSSATVEGHIYRLIIS